MANSSLILLLDMTHYLQLHCDTEKNVPPLCLSNESESLFHLILYFIYCNFGKYWPNLIILAS